MNPLKKYLKFIFGKLFVVYKTHRKGVVALTFDDGPTTWTSKILDALSQNNARASFFVLGKRIENNESLLSKVVENGSELCNHSWTHSYLNQLKYSEIKEEFEKVDRFILTHQNDSKFIRPPYGQISIKLLLFSLLNKKKVILWSKTLGGDMKINQVSSDQINEDLKSILFESGDIILLHDTNEGTANAISNIVRRLSKQGLRCVTLSEMLKME